MRECGKLNGSNRRHNCPDIDRDGDYCPKGEPRGTDKAAELSKKG